MNEQTNTPRETLAENEYVKDLFGILREHHRDTSGLDALLGHVSDMEDFAKQSEGRIADMKCQLEEMREIQNHPVKNALRNAIKSLEASVAAMKVHIAELKADIIDGCKNAVAAFKENGIGALDKLASFFRIKSGLLAIKNNIVSDINVVDRAIARNEAFSREHYKAGNALKNMLRIVIGKEPVDAKKEAGKLAKILNAPNYAHKTCLLAIKNAVDASLGKLAQLERGADVVRGIKPVRKKPKLDALIETGKVKIAHRDREKPLPQRNPQEHGAVI